MSAKHYVPVLDVLSLTMTDPSTISAVIIGGGTLPIRCAEIFLERGHKLRAVVSSDIEVRDWAAKRSIECLDPGGELAESLSRQPFDHLFSINNEHILRDDVLSLPRKMAINYHDAPLPAYAGMHATSWALISGEKTHGISWHLVTDVIDAGDILKQKTVEISETDTALTLNSKCYEAAIKAFAELTDELSSGTASALPQDLERRSYFPLFKRPSDGAVVDWSRTAGEVSALVRGLDLGGHPNPLGRAKAIVGGQLVLLRSIEILDSPSPTPPGTINQIGDDFLHISCSDLEVKLTGIADIRGDVLTALELRSRYGISEGSSLDRLDAGSGAKLSELNQRAAKREKFWLRQLSGLEPSVVPLERPEGDRRAGMRSLSLTVPAGFESVLGEETSGERRSDLLLAAFGAYTARLNCTDRFCLGLASVETLDRYSGFSGFFATEVPFSFRFSGDSSFRDFARSAIDEIDRLKKNETFARDISARYPSLKSRKHSGSGAMPAGFRIGGKADEKSDLIPGKELLLVSDDTGDDVRLLWNTARFHAGSIENLAVGFEHFLASAAENPSAAVKELPLVGKQELSKVLYEWNSTTLEYPRDRCIHELFEEQAARTPDGTALICGSERISYDRANRMANVLAERLVKSGVRAEEPVAICLPRSNELVIGILGILKAGGTYVPLDPAYPKDRSLYILEDSKARVLVTDSKLNAGKPFGDVNAVLVDDLWSGSDRDPGNPVRRASSSDLAYLIYTSGSTGKPKGVAIEHRSAVALIAWAREAFSDRELSRVLASTSVCFDLSVFEMFVPLSCGGAIVMSENLLRLPALPAADEVTLVNSVPSVINELLKTGTLPDSVRTVNLAGEPLTDALVGRLYAIETVERVNDLYGPSEDTTYSTHAVRKPGDVTIGRPIPNTQAYIVDNNLQPLPAGVPGELCLGGDGLARGYYRREELTAEKFVRNPFSRDPAARLYRTGDLARFRPDGSIVYLGRFDNQVKIRGVRIELGEIEAALLSHAAVKESVVTAFERGPGNKDLAGYVVLEGPGSADPQDILDHIKHSLPQYMIPSELIVLDAMPLTPNGKIDRKALPEPSGDKTDADREIVGARDETESRLIEIWEAVLEVRPVGVGDNFFKLGGDSLQAVHMFAEVEERFGKNIPLATLFEADTVEKLAGIIRQDGWAAPESSLVPIQPNGTRPIFFCFHARGGNVLFYRDLARHLGDDQPFYGIQARRLGGRQVGHATVEEMAEYYIQEIKTLQPEGPYYLGGTSFGGLTAFEAAQQLHKKGDKVALVALLDTGTPDYPKYLSDTRGFRSRLYSALRRIEHHRDTLAGFNWSERIDYVKGKAGSFRLRYRRKIVNGYKKLVRRFYKSRGKSLPKNYIQIEDQIGRAGQIYKPRVYPKDVVLFRASKQPLGIVPDETLGWRDLVGGELEITEVPGHHGSIITEPFVRILAGELAGAIDKALDENGQAEIKARAAQGG